MASNLQDLQGVYLIVHCRSARTIKMHCRPRPDWGWECISWNGDDKAAVDGLGLSTVLKIMAMVTGGDFVVAPPPDHIEPSKDYVYFYQVNSKEGKEALKRKQLQAS